MDLVTGLLFSEGKNTIFVIINRLTREHYFVPCFIRNNKTLAKKTARMITCYIYPFYN
jgi:hypothetical protein